MWRDTALAVPGTLTTTSPIFADTIALVRVLAIVDVFGVVWKTTICGFMALMMLVILTVLVLLLILMIMVDTRAPLTGILCNGCIRVGSQSSEDRVVLP